MAGRGRPAGYRYTDEQRAQVSESVRKNWEEDRKPWVEVYNTLREVSNGDPELARSIITEISNHPRGSDEPECLVAEPRYQEDPFEETKRIWAARRDELTCDDHGEYRCGLCKETRNWDVVRPTSPLGPDISNEEAARIGRDLIAALPWVPTEDEVTQFITDLTAFTRASVEPPEPGPKRSSGAF